MKSFNVNLSKSNSSTWWYRIIIPEDVSEYFLSQKVKRVICTINNKLEFQCGLLPAGNGLICISINKKIRTTLKLSLGDELNVTLKKDKSTYGLPMPDEMLELLSQDALANKMFHNLTPGKQRSLLHMIGSAKTSSTRIKRSVGIVRHIKSNNGKVNFVTLREDIKNTSSLF